MRALLNPGRSKLHGMLANARIALRATGTCCEPALSLTRIAKSVGTALPRRFNFKASKTFFSITCSPVQSSSFMASNIPVSS